MYNAVNHNSYYLVLRAVDNAANIGTTTVAGCTGSTPNVVCAGTSETFLIDTTPPVLTATVSTANYGNSNIWVNTTGGTNGHTITGTCTNGLQVGIGSSSAVVNPGSYTATCSGGNYTLSGIQLASGADGTRAVTVYSSSSDGSNTTQVNLNVTLDTVAPATTIDTPANNGFVTTSANISGSCEYSNSTGAPSATVQITGDLGSSYPVPVTISCAGGRFIYPGSLLLSAGEGPKTLYVSQTDLAGNTTNPPASYVYHSDLTGPAVLGSITVNKLSYNLTTNPPVLTWTPAADVSSNGVESGSGISDYYYSIYSTTNPPPLHPTPCTDILLTGCDPRVTNWTKIAGGNGVRTVLPVTTGMTPVDLATGAAANYYYAEMRAVDNVGNVGNSSPSAYFFIDNTPPILSATDTSANYVVSPAGIYAKSVVQVVTGTCDSSAGVGSVTFTEPTGHTGAYLDSAYGPYIATCSNSAYIQTLHLTAAEGAKTIIVSQADESLNTSTQTLNITLITTPPTLSVTNPTPNGFNISPIALSGLCEGGLKVYVTGDLDSSFYTSACDSVAAPCYSYTCTGSGNGIGYTTPAQVHFSAGDGAKSLTLTTTDLALNSTAHSYSFTVDNTPPTSVTNLTVIYGTSGSITSSQFNNSNNPPHVSWTASTDIGGSGVQKYEYATFAGTPPTPNPGPAPGGSPLAGWTSVGITTSVSPPTTGMTDGNTYYVAIRATDSANNLQTNYTYSAAFTLDTSLPALTITPPTSLFINTQNVTVAGTCEATRTVNFSGTGLDGTSATSTTCDATAGTYSQALVLVKGASTGGTDGNRVVNVDEKDEALNSATTQTVTFVMITNPPNLTITAPAGGFVGLNGTTISGSCETSTWATQVSFSGPATLLGGGAITDFTCSGNNYSKAVVFTGADGNKTITVTQSDQSSNAVNKTVTVTLDATPPVFPDSDSVTLNFANGTTSFNLVGNRPSISWTSATDTGGSGMNRHEYSVHQVGKTNATGTILADCGADCITDWTSAGLTVSNFNPSTSGMVDGVSYYFQIRAVDNVSNKSTDNGNVSATALLTSANFAIDTSSPTLTATIAPANLVSTTYYANTTVLTISGGCENTRTITATGASALDNAYGPYVATCGASVANTYSITSVHLLTGNGSKPITVTEVDEAGNSTTQTLTVVLDTVSPIVSITAPTGAYVARAVTVTGACESSSTVNAATLTGTFTGGSPTGINPTCSGSSYSQSVTFPAGDADGTTETITVTQSDYAGNSIPQTKSFTLDSTAPNPVASVTVQYPTSATAFNLSGNPPTFSWSADTDPTVNGSSSGINHYEYSIYNATSNAQVTGWTSVGTALTVSRTANMSNGVSYYAQVRAVDNVGNVSTVAGSQELASGWTPQWNSIVGYWKMNGDWSDSTGNNNYGTAYPLGNGPTFTSSSILGSAAGSFSGSAYTQIDPTNFNFERTQPFSISAWVKGTSTANQFVVAKKESTGQTIGWGLKTDDDGATGHPCLVLQGSGSTTYSSVCAQVNVEDGNWHHIVAVNLATSGGQTSDLRVYVDGAAPSLANDGHNLGTNSILNSASLDIGSRDGGGAAFQGNIDDVAIWNVALSASDAQAIYDAQTAQPQSASWTIDTVAPTISITAPTALITKLTSQTIQGACEIGLPVVVSGTGLTASYNNVSCASGSYSQAVTLSTGDGPKVVSVSQTDAALNTGTQALNMTLDTTPPNLTVTGPGNLGAATPQNINLAGACENGLAVSISDAAGSAGTNLVANVNFTCSGTTYSQALQFTSGDGTKSFVLSSTDVAGNTSTLNWNYVIDSQPPNTVAGLTVHYPAGATNFNKSTNAPNITWTSDTDQGGSGIGHYDYSVHQYGKTDATGTLLAHCGIDCVTDWASIGNVTTVNPSTGNMSDPNTYYVEVRAVDGAGNIGAYGSSANFTIDTTAPALTWSNASGLANPIQPTGLTTTMTGTCETGDTVTFTGAGLSPSSQTASCTSSAFSQSLTFTTGDGAKVVNIDEIDGALNHATAVASKTFYVDTTAPSITITSPANNFVTSTGNTTGVILTGFCEAGLTVNVTGNVASPGSFPCTGSIGSPGAATAYTTTAIVLSGGDGNKVITLKSTDTAGNTNAGTNITIVQDATAPSTLATVNLLGISGSVTEYNLKGAAPNNNPPTVGWTAATDATSGVKNYEYALYTCPGGTVSTGGCNVGGVSAPSGVGTGGTLNNWCSGSCTGSSGIAGGWTNAGSVTSVVPTLISGSLAGMVDGGFYYVAVRAIDNAGNIGTLTNSSAFQIDNTAPALTSTAPANGTLITSNVTYTGACDNAFPLSVQTGSFVTVNSGSSCSAGISPSTTSTTACACSSGAYTINATMSGLTGPRALTISQTDEALNVTSFSISVLMNGLIQGADCSQYGYTGVLVQLTTAGGGGNPAAGSWWCADKYANTLFADTSDTGVYTSQTLNATVQAGLYDTPVANYALEGSSNDTNFDPNGHKYIGYPKSGGSYAGVTYQQARKACAARQDGSMLIPENVYNDAFAWSVANSNSGVTYGTSTAEWVDGRSDLQNSKCGLFSADQTRYCTGNNPWVALLNNANAIVTAATRSNGTTGNAYQTRGTGTTGPFNFRCAHAVPNSISLDSLAEAQAVYTPNPTYSGTCDAGSTLYLTYDAAKVSVPSATALTAPTGSLKLWLKADAGLYQDNAGTQPVTATGQGVGQWADQSGNGNNAIQTSTPNRPIYTTGVINGVPVVRFNGGTGNYLSILNQSNWLPSDFSIIAVSRLAATGSWNIAPIIAQDTASGLFKKWIFSYANNNETFEFYNSVDTQINTGTLFPNPSGFNMPYILDVFRKGSNFSFFMNDLSEPITSGNNPTANAIPSMTNIPVTIGYGESSGTLNGDISEIFVYTRALSDIERMQLEGYLNNKYNLTANTVMPVPKTTLPVSTVTCDGTGHYSFAANFTTPAIGAQTVGIFEVDATGTIGTPINRTVLLDGVGTGYACNTYDSGSNLVNEGRYVYGRSAGNDSNSTNASELASNWTPHYSSIQGYWKFNNDFTDAVGSNNGTNHGASFTSFSRQGAAAANLDGSTSYVDLGNSSALRIASGLSVQAWIYPITTGTATSSWAISMPYTDAAGWNSPWTGYGIGFQSGSPHFWININGTDREFSAGSMPLNAWSHVALTFDGTWTNAYINGVQVYSSNTYTGSIQYSGSPHLVIGARSVNSLAEYFQGYVDEAAVWNTALSASDIQTLYRNNNPNTWVAGNYWCVDKYSNFVFNDTNGLDTNGHAYYQAGEPSPTNMDIRNITNYANFLNVPALNESYETTTLNNDNSSTYNGTGTKYVGASLSGKTAAIYVSYTEARKFCAARGDGSVLSPESIWYDGLYGYTAGGNPTVNGLRATAVNTVEWVDGRWDSCPNLGGHSSGNCNAPNNTQFQKCGTADKRNGLNGDAGDCSMGATVLPSFRGLTRYDWRQPAAATTNLYGGAYNMGFRCAKEAPGSVTISSPAENAVLTGLSQTYSGTCATGTSLTAYYNSTQLAVKDLGNGSTIANGGTITNGGTNACVSGNFSFNVTYAAVQASGTKSLTITQVDAMGVAGMPLTRTIALNGIAIGQACNSHGNAGVVIQVASAGTASPATGYPNTWAAGTYWCVDKYPDIAFDDKNDNGVYDGAGGNNGSEVRSSVNLQTMIPTYNTFLNVPSLNESYDTTTRNNDDSSTADGTGHKYVAASISGATQTNTVSYNEARKLCAARGDGSVLAPENVWFDGMTGYANTSMNSTLGLQPTTINTVEWVDGRWDSCPNGGGHSNGTCSAPNNTQFQKCSVGDKSLSNAGNCSLGSSVAPSFRGYNSYNWRQPAAATASTYGGIGMTFRCARPLVAMPAISIPAENAAISSNSLTYQGTCTPSATVTVLYDNTQLTVSGTGWTVNTSVTPATATGTCDATLGTFSFLASYIGLVGNRIVNVMQTDSYGLQSAPLTRTIALNGVAPGQVCSNNGTAGFIMQIASVGNDGSSSPYPNTWAAGNYWCVDRNENFIFEDKNDNRVYDGAGGSGGSETIWTNETSLNGTGTVNHVLGLDVPAISTSYESTNRNNDNGSGHMFVAAGDGGAHFTQNTTYSTARKACAARGDGSVLIPDNVWLDSSAGALNGTNSTLGFMGMVSNSAYMEWTDGLASNSNTTFNNCNVADKSNNGNCSTAAALPASRGYNNSGIWGYNATTFPYTQRVRCAKQMPQFLTITTPTELQTVAAGGTLTFSGACTSGTVNSTVYLNYDHTNMSVTGGDNSACVGGTYSFNVTFGGENSGTRFVTVYQTDQNNVQSAAVTRNVVIANANGVGLASGMPCTGSNGSAGYVVKISNQGFDFSSIIGGTNTWDVGNYWCMDKYDASIFDDVNGNKNYDSGETYIADYSASTPLFNGAAIGNSSGTRLAYTTPSDGGGGVNYSEAAEATGGSANGNTDGAATPHNFVAAIFATAPSGITIPTVNVPYNAARKACAARGDVLIPDNVWFDGAAGATTGGSSSTIGFPNVVNPNLSMEILDGRGDDGTTRFIKCGIANQNSSTQCNANSNTVSGLAGVGPIDRAYGGNNSSNWSYAANGYQYSQRFRCAKYLGVSNTLPLLTNVQNMQNNATPTRSWTWQWGCSMTGCTYHYVIDTSPITIPSGGTFNAYSSTATVTQSAGTNIYYIHVQAKSALGDEGPVVHFSTVMDNTAPIISSVVVQSPTAINVTWTTYQGATMAASATTLANYALSDTGQGSFATNPTGISLVSGTTYQLTWNSGYMTNGGNIKITATNVYDTPGNTAQTIGNATAGTANGGAPGPTITNVTNMVDDVNYPAPHSTWTWAWGCSRTGCTYRYLVDQDPNTTPSQATYGATTTATQNTGSGTYYIHVQAKDSGNNEGPVTTAKVYIDTVVPGVFTITSAVGGNAQATLTWSSAANATSYNLSYGTSSGTYTAGTVTNATSPATVSSLTNDQPYYFMVTAVRAGGNQNAAKEATVTPSSSSPNNFMATWGFEAAEQGNYYIAPSDSTKISFTSGGVCRLTPVSFADASDSLGTLAGTTSSTDFGGGTGTSVVWDAANVDNGVTNSIVKLDPTLTTGNVELNSSWTPSYGNIVAYWNLNGSGSITNGTNIPAVIGPTGTAVVAATHQLTYIPGQLNQGINFDGVGGDYITLGSPTGLPTGAAARTMCAWAKTNTTGGVHVIASYGGAGGSLSFGLYQNGVALYNYYYGSDTYAMGGFWEPGVWNHVCLTYTGSGGTPANTISTYANGIKVYTQVITLNTSLANVQISGNLGSGGSPWDGGVDELAFWNVALSADNIQTIYSAQSAMFAKSPELASDWTPAWNNLVSYWKMNGSTAGGQITSGTANSVPDAKGSNHGTPVHTTGSMYYSSGVLGNVANASGGLTTGGSISFNGGDAVVNVASPTGLPTGSSAYTMSAWINPTRMDNNYGIIGYGVNTWYQMNALRLENGYIRHYWSGDDLAVSIPYSLVGSWHHVLATFNGTTRSVYLDGVLLGSDLPNNVSAHIVTAVNFTIGKDLNSGLSFNGNMDDVAIWNVGLTASEVQTIYSRQSSKFSGTLLSRVFDAGVAAGSWANIGWTTTLPFSKNLPDAAGVAASTNESNSSGTGYSSLASSTLMSGILGLWHLDETVATSNTNSYVSGVQAGDYNDFVDSSGNSNFGELSPSAPTYATFGGNGKLGKAIGLGYLVSTNATNTSTNAGIAIADSPTTRLSSNASFTISAWVYPQTPTGQIYNYGYFGASLGLNSSTGKLESFINGLGANTVDSTTTVPLNTWSHVTLTMSGGARTFYINGVADTCVGATCSGMSNCSGSSNPACVSTLGSMIGNAPSSTSGVPAAAAYGFQGSMDEVAVWGRALSSTEVGQLYRRGASRVKMQVRSCSDSVCTTPSAWKGPDGTNETYFTELNNNTTPITGAGSVLPTLPSMTLSAFTGVTGMTGTHEYAQYRTILETDSLTIANGPELQKVSMGTSNFPTSSPSIAATAGVNGVNYSNLTSYIETLGAGNCASGVTYALSQDAATWYYWTGSTWSSLSSGTPAPATSTAAAINTNIAAYVTLQGPSTVYFKAFLNSNGTNACEIDQISLKGNL